uniref:Uncharacterized protein n=1 Tax=Romanomermis culicivorax TaxID=13658 RepID=A0A915JXT3_ROMCU
MDVGRFQLVLLGQVQGPVYSTTNGFRPGQRFNVARKKINCEVLQKFKSFIRRRLFRFEFGENVANIVGRPGPGPGSGSGRVRTGAVNLADVLGTGRRFPGHETEYSARRFGTVGPGFRHWARIPSMEEKSRILSRK